MRIVCCGMRRSGSTWLYNVVRMACGGAAGRVWAGFEDTFEPIDVDHRVVKAHAFDVAWVFGADRVFGSIRDLRDVAASAVRRGLVPPTVEKVVRWLFRTAIEEHEAWEGYCNAIVRYEDMIVDKVAAARAVIDGLDLGDNVDAEAIVKGVDALPMPGRIVNPVTLLHHDHFTDGGVGTFTKTLCPEIVAAIDVIFGPWMARRGYPPKPAATKPASPKPAAPKPASPKPAEAAE